MERQLQDHDINTLFIAYINLSTKRTKIKRSFFDILKLMSEAGGFLKSIHLIF